MLDGSRLTETNAGGQLWAAAVVAALVMLATTTLSSVLGVSTSRLLPAVAVAATPALLIAAGLLSPRAAVAMMVVSAPLTLLAAGLPLGTLAPGGWAQLLVSLGRGATQLVAATTGPAITAWSVAAVALLAGGIWTAGAALETSTPRRSIRTRLAFALLAVPWLAGLSLRPPDHVAWEGAAVLVAGVLWFSRARSALPLAVMVAVPSAVLAQAVGPRSQWFGLPALAPVDPPFRTLDAEPTYDRLTDRRTGTTMLIISSPVPALWRMQTLDYSAGRWIIGGDALPDLPEPAARRVRLRVRVAGLRQNLLVAPGHVDHVQARGKISRTQGEGVLLSPTPATGDTYQIDASYVRVTAGQLSRDRAPLDPRARAYTRVQPLGASPGTLQPLIWLFRQFGLAPPALKQFEVDSKVAALSRRLARGAHSQWAIVTRVEHYLLDSGLFRYTTNVPDPGAQPLVDFLFRTRAGYCQQFAGAAALLLRLAGVPARVVTGFATGQQEAPGTYAVRDLDAHEWIEVYFEGYGWVPFNPTPAADATAVAAGIDPLMSPPGAVGRPGHLDIGAVVLALAAAGLLTLRRRRRSGEKSTEWIYHVARGAGGRIEPSTTLAEIRRLLAVRVGPRTAALAAALERERFAAVPPASVSSASTASLRVARGRIEVTRALLGDLGPFRALLLWVPRRRRRTRLITRAKRTRGTVL